MYFRESPIFMGPPPTRGLPRICVLEVGREASG